MPQVNQLVMFKNIVGKVKGIFEVDHQRYYELLLADGTTASPAEYLVHKYRDDNITVEEFDKQFRRAVWFNRILNIGIVVTAAVLGVYLFR